MTTIWVRNEEITAFCDDKINFNFPAEYGEKKVISENVVIIAGKIYIEGSAVAAAAQVAYDALFSKEKGGDCDNVGA